MKGISTGALVVARPFGGMLNGTAVVPGGADADAGGMITGDGLLGAGACERISGLVDGAIDVAGIALTNRRG